eukprot:6469606-Amphidinium_carterae.1
MQLSFLTCSFGGRPWGGWLDPPFEGINSSPAEVGHGIPEFPSLAKTNHLYSRHASGTGNQ